MKLNLNTKNINKPKPLVNPESKYASPVGWWKVTTEGDEEGRSTEDLGVYYGHVAEIAFHLADKVFYKLEFSPESGNPPPAKHPTYEAKKKSVWISLDSESNTYGMSPEARALWFTKWLNVTDPKIVCWGKAPTGCTYYAGCYLELKGK